MKSLQRDSHLRIANLKLETLFTSIEGQILDVTDHFNCFKLIQLFIYFRENNNREQDVGSFQDTTECLKVELNDKEFQTPQCDIEVLSAGKVAYFQLNKV